MEQPLAGPWPSAQESGARRAQGSLREQAYRAIKRSIITMAYRPGEYVNEARVSADLGIGRTPVHQALDRLMLEGMVEVIPRKGVIVRPVSLEEVQQLIEVRLVNEPYCAALAAKRATSSELSALHDVLARTDDHIAVLDMEALMELDREFHMGISRAAKNRVLADVLLQLHERSLRFWFISLSDKQHALQVREEHGAVLRAIESRDGETAASTIRAHIQSFREHIIKSI